jgi:hypothetical protein
VDNSTIGLVWRRSSRCDSGACVEVASIGDEFAVRDSKVSNSAVLRFSRAQWSDFVAGVRAGDYDFR